MSVTHTHPLAKDGSGSHVDHFGKKFGDDEHTSAWEEAKASSLSTVEHTHSSVVEQVDEDTGNILWRVARKKKDEATEPAPPAKLVSKPPPPPVSSVKV